MSQSKRHSALETATNTAVGFVGSYFITFGCFHLDADLATKTLYATLGCTVWSLLRGYYLRRLFNHLHTKPVVSKELERQVPHCHHFFVDGFGGMGDAVVCCKCGLDKYPEAISVEYEAAKRLQRVIPVGHPNYESYADLARSARLRASAQ